jgi:hypothetical protein
LNCGDSRTAGPGLRPQGAVADLRDLKIRIDFRLDSDQIALPFQKGDELTKVFAWHWRDPERYFYL